MSEKDVSANPPPSPETLKEKSAAHKSLNPPFPSTKSIPGTEMAGPPLSSSGSPDQPPKSTPSSSQDTKLKQTNGKTANLPARSTAEKPATPKPAPTSSHISKTTLTMPATTSSSLSKSTLSSPDDPSTPSITTSADPTQSTSPPEGSLSSTKIPAVGSSIPRQRSFLAAAQKVMMQEKIRKAEEDAKAEECDDMDEDLPFEELLEKAEAGDPRAQSRLGKYYLKLAEETDTETNNCSAVEWFVKAAKQGRRDAAKLLQKCWIQKKGITPENAQEVRRLSSESKLEQAVRRAAMSMYWKLNPDRKKKVAMSEMLENVSQVNTIPGEPAVCGVTPSIHTQRKILQTMVCNESSSKYVDVEDFVEMTKKFTEGIACAPTLRTSGVDATGEEKTLSKSDVATFEMERNELAPVTHKRHRKSSWGMSGSGMILTTRRSGAMKRALDIKSHFLGLQYPLHVIIEMKELLIDWASRAGVQWLSTIIPTQHVNALIFFFIISNLTIDLFAFVIPLLIFYLSFISMAICTLRVFKSSKGWENFSALTALLTRFEPSLDVEQAESNFGWNNMEQYLYFMISVFFTIFTFPVADKGWIPCSELSTVAIFFTAMSYMSLSPSAAAYARRALIIEVASSLCALTSRLPKEMAMARMLGHIFTTIPLGESLVLELSVPCVLYIYLFYLFFSMARMRGFRGTYCFLVPYLVCFVWCEFSVVLLWNSTTIGLIRTCVAYFLFLFALPVLALGLMAMLLIQMVKWFLELELTKMLVTLAVCAVPVILRLWTRFSLSILNVFHSITHRGPVKLILLCITTVILLCGVYVYNAEGLKVYNSTITWQEYGTLCGPRAWQDRGMAQTQLFCSHLEGHRVTWTGIFRRIHVAEKENGAQSVINLLPVFMGDWLRCLYGEVYPKCEPQNNKSPVANVTGVEPVNATMLFLQQGEEELCRIKAFAKHQCHVKRFDSYRFEVTVGMPVDGVTQVDDPAGDILLMASHEFKQVLLNLDPGSMVEFSTKLEGKLGTKLPAFELKAIHCLDCSSSLVPEGRQVKIERNWRKTMLKAIKFAFDFFFAPFLCARISV
ncbi:wolframin [Sinocyclocheilus anshuiensis]|uniref:wolframin n=1 Tax=Sinocyclocheilus anshuiensis TaxID=1608454 RepID=UPI0007B7D4EE|nr:PREDICTED: wolframin-like [Sinocyclocheilus anshuiensis]